MKRITVFVLILFVFSIFVSLSGNTRTLDPPSNFQAELITYNTAELTWNPPANLEDETLIGYSILRYNEPYATVNDPTITEFIDADMDEGGYVYTIIAEYDEGSSDPTEAQYVFIDFDAPFLSVSVNGMSIFFGITPPPNNPYVLEYHIYDSGSLMLVFMGGFYLHPGLQGIHYFTAYAVYEGGVYSPPSNTVVVEITETEQDIISLENSFDGIYPNPFNPTTTISFSVTQTSSFVNLEVFNIKGEKVKLLVNDQFPAGQHSIVWNGEDESGKPVASGVYYCQMQCGDFQAVKKMILLK
jgi:FlgD Ig-like domain